MRVFWHIARAALVGVVFSTPVLAQGWGSFYEPSQKNAVTSTARTLAAKGGPEGVCIREILAAQTRHGIPDNLLLAIGLQEAGTRRNGHFTVWPYAVNAAGEGRLFDNRNAALDWVAERQASGIRSIDVGCMQINMRWHPDAFASVSEGFDPRVNVDYAARFLKRLHRRTGSWMQAAGSYHSFEPEYRDVYLDRLQKNISAANARLPEFQALASASPVAVRPRKPAAKSSGSYDRLAAKATWGAQIGGAENARRSLYSAHEMQPVLPQFTTVKAENAG
ncbi:lytic transglycosylase domain-containing protein [Sulfitobacter sp. AS92]|uniref:lytic transglycosylase domain-containing protein n=1 Tax=Sulfitobacter sp. AS92 TaxID=3135783 RepID=UPI00318012B6